jgi:carboxylesterase
VKEVILEQSYHVATLDHDADRIHEESLAFIGRIASALGKEAGLGKEGTTAGG